MNEGFDFDLADKHRVFFEYIRDKKWDSVASFIDKKCIMHSGPCMRYSTYLIDVPIQLLFYGLQWATNIGVSGVP